LGGESRIALWGRWGKFDAKARRLKERKELGNSGAVANHYSLTTTPALHSSPSPGSHWPVSMRLIA